MPSDYDRIRADHIREYGEGTRHLAFLDRLYPDRTHFLFELLQNAEDAGATVVRIALRADRLEVRHDGRPFDERDVRAICGVDAGAKADDLTMIGKYGIGFKSVYAYTTAPEVHCGGEHFRIEAYVRPYATAPRPLAPGETLFVLPFSRPEADRDRARAEIGARLYGFEPLNILFLRHIRRLEWTAADASGAIERRTEELTTAGGPSGPEMRRVTLRRGAGGASSDEHWLVFARRTPLGQAGERDRPARWVEIAFRLERDAEGRERIAAVPNSRLVVFFPTERETHLGFVLQGPFKTTPARDNVPGDDGWNRRLIEDAARLTVESLPALRDLGLLDVSCLTALPIRAADFPREGMFRPIFDQVRRAFQEQDLLPAAVDRQPSPVGFLPAARARLAASQALRDLLTPRQLTALYRSGEPLGWICSEVDATAMPDLHHYLRFQLGVAETTPEAVAVRCDEEFLRAQPDDWMARFYGFLASHPALWQPAGGPWGSQPGVLRERPILRLAGGAHVRPFRDDGAPAAYLPPREPTEYPVIEPRIAADPRAREFLQRLGLREPDVVAEVLERILGKYGSAGAPEPRGIEHQRDLEKIFRALAAASDAERRHLVERLERTPFVLARNPVGEERARRPTQVYVPRPELEEYFAGDESAWFVAEGAEPGAELGGWAALGVESRPRRIADDRALALDEKRALRGDRQARWTADRDVIDYELHGLENFLRRFDADPPRRAERSLLLWQLLCELCDGWPRGRRERVFQGEYRWYYHEEELSASFPSAFLVRLREHAWLPAPDGSFVRPAEVALSELPGEYYREEALAAALGMGLGELDRFAREHGVSPDLLRFAVEHPEEVELLRRRHQDDRSDTDEAGPADVRFTAVDFGAALEEAFTSAPPVAAPAAEETLGPDGSAFPPETSLGARLQRLGEVDRPRFARVPRRVWTRAESPLAAFFLAQYDGRCQVCGDSFRMRSGAPYWEGLYLVPAARARFPNRPGNVLALCASCCARFLYGPVEAEQLREQVERAAGQAEPRLCVRLCGQPRTVHFTPAHFADLRAILSEVGG